TILARAILPLLIDALARLRILDIARRSTHQLPQRRHRRRAEVWSRNSRVEIHIRSRVRPQFISHLFGPFSRADEPILLRIPTAKNDRAAWLPALFQQLTKAAAHFKHRRRAAVWIDGAKHPRIAMVSEHDPPIPLFVAVDARDDVPDRPQLVIHVSLQTELHVVRAADVISERQ